MNIKYIDRAKGVQELKSTGRRIRVLCPALLVTHGVSVLLVLPAYGRLAAWSSGGGGSNSHPLDDSIRS